MYGSVTLILEILPVPLASMLACHVDASSMVNVVTIVSPWEEEGEEEKKEDELWGRGWE
jgi:hypothetical protein